MCSDGVYDIYIDKGRYIWIATYTGGVTLVDAVKNQFRLDNLSSRPDYFLHNNHINALYEDSDGDMWYATNQGIAVHIKNKNEWRYFLEDEGVFLCLSSSSDESKVWAGGFGAGLVLLDKRKGIVERHNQNDNSGLTTNYIYTIHRDKSGDLWIGGSYGKLVKVELPFSKEKSIIYDAEYINKIEENNKGEVTIATANGCAIVTDNNDLRWFAKSKIGDINDYNSFIYCFYFESDSIEGSGRHFQLLPKGIAGGTKRQYICSAHVCLCTDTGNASVNVAEIVTIGGIVLGT